MKAKFHTLQDPKFDRVEATFRLIELAAVCTSPILLCSPLLTFLPDSFLSAIGAATIRNGYRGLVALAPVFTASTIIISVLTLVRRRIKAWKKRPPSARQMELALESLTRHEKQILQFYIIRRSRTEYWSPLDRGIKRLVGKGILCRNTYVATVINDWSFDIRPHWYQYLMQHKERLVSSE
ncbi:MAG: super-infection exclusion protein B [Spirochaetia bacterium]|jgi:hypothetical protein